MTQGDFENGLRSDGFDDIVAGEMKPNESRPAHAHDYDLRAFIVAGSISLVREDGKRRYDEGDAFSLAAGEAHAEEVGANGVRYIFGRRRR